MMALVRSRTDVNMTLLHGRVLYLVCDHSARIQPVCLSFDRIMHAPCGSDKAEAGRSQSRSRGMTCVQFEA